MKSILSILILSTIMFSCSNSNLELQEDDLIGGWSSTNILINDKPASEFMNGWEFYSNFLGLRPNQFYYMNYSTGEWRIDGDILTMSGRGIYKVIDFQEDRMTIEGEILAGQYYWGLEGVEEDEFIIVKEEYLRD